MYIGIAKVDNDKFVKYHFRDIVRFKKFLMEKYKGFRYCNVYEAKTRLQRYYFTKYSGIRNV